MVDAADNPRMANAVACDVCGDPASPDLACPRCGARHYCGEQCRRADWYMQGHWRSCMGPVGGPSEDLLREEPTPPGLPTLMRDYIVRGGPGIRPVHPTGGRASYVTFDGDTVRSYTYHMDIGGRTFVARIEMSEDLPCECDVLLENADEKVAVPNESAFRTSNSCLHMGTHYGQLWIDFIQGHARCGIAPKRMQRLFALARVVLQELGYVGAVYLTDAMNPADEAGNDTCYMPICSLRYFANRRFVFTDPASLTTTKVGVLRVRIQGARQAPPEGDQAEAGKVRC